MIDSYFEHRRLLFATAYQMLGGVAEAEDVNPDKLGGLRARPGH